MNVFFRDRCFRFILGYLNIKNRNRLSYEVSVHGGAVSHTKKKQKNLALLSLHTGTDALCKNGICDRSTPFPGCCGPRPTDFVVAFFKECRYLIYNIGAHVIRSTYMHTPFLIRSILSEYSMYTSHNVSVAFRSRYVENVGALLKDCT
jgi:hypothetical protein